MSITVSEGATVAFNRAQLAQMFAHAPGFMALLVGPEHRFELTNPNYQTLIGHRSVAGCALADVLKDAVDQGYLALLDTVYRTGRPHHAEARSTPCRRRRTGRSRSAIWISSSSR